jgi:hypothetical protein
MKGYVKKEVVEIVGLTHRLIQYYTEEGIVSPEFSQGGERGRRGYSRKNLFEFKIVKSLYMWGVNLAQMKATFNAFQTPYPLEDKLAGGETVVVGYARIMDNWWNFPSTTCLMLYKKSSGEIKIVLSYDGPKIDLENFVDCESVLVLAVGEMVRAIKFAPPYLSEE